MFYNNRQSAGLKILKTLFSLLCIFTMICPLAGCRKEENNNAGIEIRIEEQMTENGSTVQIPVFYSENEEVRKKLKELDKETEDLRKIVEKEQKNGSYIEMTCYPAEIKNYPQVTVVWYVPEEDTHVYHLVTLGADVVEGLPITCREALEMAGMSGVDLSLKVGKLEMDSEVRGQLQSTEMEGFRINEDGRVTEIYMKLTMKVGEGGNETTEEHFFSYLLEEEKLVKLSEKGFDIP